MKELVVLGGGISGLATSHAIQEMAREKGLELRLTLVERENRLGGKIRSVKEKGFLCETGPAGFLDNRPETLELAGKLGLEVLPSREAAKKRFVYVDGRLHLVPGSPTGFLLSDILSVKGRLRVLLEVFTRPGSEEDESISSFARRHLGREAEEKLISAMVTGIFAGDAERLSVRSCFPVMLELEREGGGSLIKAMLRRMRKARKGGGRAALPSGRLVSFASGMQELTDAIAKAVEGEILTGRAVEAVRSGEGSGYEVALKDGERLYADALVLALPAYAAAAVLKELDDELSRTLKEIPYAPATVVCLGYRLQDLPQPLDGFGFLIPKKENRGILGCRWDSTVFEARAPPGHALLWTIVGGALKPELARLERSELLRLVKRELREIMGIEKEPVLIRIFRHEKAIPQYVIGHEKMLERIEERRKMHPGLYITGNAFRGVGVNDCTRNALVVAREVVRYLSGAEEV